jgi:predicted MFS family arabinose efflux permease
MSGPGIYSLLMSKTPEAERGTASAIQNIVNSLSQSAAAALAGILFVRYGYPRVVAGNGGMAILAAVILFLLLGSKKRRAAGA